MVNNKNIFSLYLSAEDEDSEIIVETNKSHEDFIKDCKEICEEYVQLQILECGEDIEEWRLYDWLIFDYLRVKIYMHPDYKQLIPDKSIDFEIFLLHISETLKVKK